MNKTKTLVSIIAAGLAAAVLSVKGDTTTLLLDTRTEPQMAESIDVTYDASWIGGDAGATVVISDNGIEVRRTTGVGEFTYNIPTGSGRHELTYATFVGGVAQGEVYRATATGYVVVSFDATPSGLPGNVAHSFTVTNFAYGDIVDTTIPLARTGYSFDGWSVYGISITGQSAITVVTNHTLTAIWTPNEYTAAFDGNGGEVGTALNTVTFDAAYGALPGATRTGYTFSDWTLNGETVTAETICTTPSNHTLVASWTPNEYTVAFDAKGGMLGAGEASKHVTFDAAYGALPVPTHHGYVFLDWLLNGAAVDAATIVRTANNHTLSAKWGITIGNGVWEETICDGPITLGAPLLAPSGAVEIPAEIDGRPIAAIEASAFAGNTAITAITIPTNVTELVNGCFAGCTGLREVVIPASVTNISSTAFSGCTGIRKVSVGSRYGYEKFADLLDAIMPDADCSSIEFVGFLDGVEAIPDNFFEGCTSLKSMDIPERVVDIGTNVFEACSELAVCVADGLRMYQGWCFGREVGELGVGELVSW